MTSEGRRSIRLGGYDYSKAGAYFVTICVLERCRGGFQTRPNDIHPHLFGNVVDGKIRLNESGRIVLEAWRDLPRHYDHVELDEFVVMPNHVHAIIVLTMENFARAGFKPAPTRHPLSEIVRAFKTFSGRRINDSRGTPGVHVWQRNYYEHIIRDQSGMDRIRKYIAANPHEWE